MKTSQKRETARKELYGFQVGKEPEVLYTPLKRKLKFENYYKICVSGAAAGVFPKAATEMAFEVGRQIGLQGAVLLTGATTGIPYIAANGNHDVGGLAIGFSPASSAKEHVRSYRLPIEYHDVIVYTGFNYSGRNLLLTRASDAVITIAGRIGTLNEFTIAFEDKKVCGILEGSGGMADHIRELINLGQKKADHVIFDTDPKRLVARVVAKLKDGYQAEGAARGTRDIDGVF